MIPLDLGSRTQSALAEMSALASSTKTKMNSPIDWNTPLDMAAIGEKFCEILERFDMSPQDWGKTYDKLHRTGANS